MKKQNLVNLVRYHVEKNEEAFISEVAAIAKDFDSAGDEQVAQYLMELISNSNMYVPQTSYRNFRFLEKVDYSSRPLYLPNIIEDDVIGITKAINRKSGLSKFLFHGAPGTGKTESVYQIGRLLQRDILYVSAEQLIDSRLGETAKNIHLLFEEINHLPYNRVIVLFDEIDSLVLDRVNKNDLREMGRVTSAFLKELDALNDNIIIIATTNLFSNLDKAIIRRFDATVSFDRYSSDDIIEIAEMLLTTNLKKSTVLKQDIRLFRKILKNLPVLPTPGELVPVIRSSIAFCDETNEYDYLRRIFLALNNISGAVDIQKLKDEGYTTREIEILSRIPKSSVSRKLRDK